MVRCEKNKMNSIANVTYDEHVHLIGTMTGIKIIAWVRVSLSTMGLFLLFMTLSSLPYSIFVFFCVILVFYAILTWINLFSLKYVNGSYSFSYVIIAFEAIVPTIMKINYYFDNRPVLIINENLFFSLYFLILILTFFYYRTGLMIVCGAISLLSYIGLLLLVIYRFDVPVSLSENIPGHIILDEEIIRIVWFVCYVIICLTVLRNIKFYIKREKQNSIAIKKRADILADILTAANDISYTLKKSAGRQRDIGQKFINISKNQAAMSEEMSASFQELIATTSSIHDQMNVQLNDSTKADELILVLQSTYNDVYDSSEGVIKAISELNTFITKTIEQMNRIDSSMGEIDIESHGIYSALELLDNINDRINLLSLNASIEAARAGEAGKGFAVLAQEVGKLSFETTTHFKEISNIINRIVMAIQEGIGIVENNSLLISNIENSTKAIDDRISVVMNAMNIQKSAINDVANQLGLVKKLALNITNASQEQLANMEENNSNIENLASIAQVILQMNEEMQNFTSSIDEQMEILTTVLQKED